MFIHLNIYIFKSHELSLTYNYGLFNIVYYHVWSYYHSDKQCDNDLLAIYVYYVFFSIRDKG